jgi:AcrR family transcriptional regulator
LAIEKVVAKSKEGRTSARGRPRLFDKDEALVAATRIFWKHGYAGASISTLLAAMGMNRASMYATFGNKEALFRCVIERYGDEKAAYMMKALEQPTARAVAQHLLQGTMDLQTDRDRPQGTMGVVHSFGVGPGDDSVRRFIAERGAYWREKLIERIEQAQSDGDFPADVDARSLALTLKAATDGLLAASYAGAGEEELEGIVSLFMSLWPGR